MPGAESVVVEPSGVNSKRAAASGEVPATGGVSPQTVASPGILRRDGCKDAARRPRGSLCALGVALFAGCVRLREDVKTLLSPLPPGACGQPALSFLVAFAVLWTTALLLVFYDGMQLWRGKLSGTMRWLRTVPALLTVLTAPAVAFFIWVARNA